MQRPLRALVIEDSADDCELMLRVLERAGHRITHERVQTAGEMEHALRERTWDIVLADYSLPRFGASRGLEILQASGHDIPFIIVSGSIGEEAAVAAMKAGAHDYVMKDNLARLPLSVARELRDADLRRERADLEQALKRNEERLRLAIESVNAGIWEWSVGTDHLYMSERRKAFVGCGADLPDTRSAWRARIHPDDRPAVEAELDSALTGSAGTVAFEYRVRHEDGGWRWIQSRGKVIRDADGRPVRLSGLDVDVTERRQAEARIHHLAHHDALTDLPNRTLLLDRLHQALAHARRHRSNVAVLILDLDDFKEVNDLHGHPAGDKLLCAVAERLRGSVRESDTLARFGGDEFAVIQPELRSREGAAVLAQKIVDAISEPFCMSGHDLDTGVSVGVAIFPDDGEDPDVLLRNADLALYRAKGEGRSRFRFFAKAMDDRLRARRSLESELRRALDRDEFGLVFQPQIDLDSGRVVAAEALLRWHHPERGLLTPPSFIQAAESGGVIRAIGAWVLRSACTAACGWRDAGHPIGVSVNLSPAEFRQPALAMQIERILLESGLEPERLELEITESLFRQEWRESMASTLRRIAGPGVRLAVDDFGTGYSSLAHIKRFPVGRIKIDTSFVHDIGRDSEDEAIVTAVVALGHGLGRQVVAEGVETEQQLAFLRARGCDFAQGYLLGRPAAADEIVQRLIEPPATPGTPGLREVGVAQTLVEVGSTQVQ